MAVLLSYALTTVSDVKESLGIASSDTTKDNLIIRKINQATRAIENYCGRRFALTTYTDEAYNGIYTDEIVLKQRPIVGTPSLSFRDTALNVTDSDVVETDLYFVNANTGTLQLLFKAVGHWQRFLVTYQAGYSTIPEDLAEACVSLACYYVVNADATDVGVLQKKEGQRELRYAKTGLTFKTIIENLGVDEIIDSYANWPISGEG